jgi:phosphoglycolate phosphatase
LENILIFDLDGTLLDSKAGILFSLEYVLKRNAPEFLPFLDQSIIGPPIKKILEGFVTNPQVVSILSKEFRSHYDSYGYLETRLFKGVLDGLKKISKLPLYVSTNKPEKVTSKVLSKLEIDFFFNEVVSIDSQPYTGKSEIVRRIKNNNNSKKIVVIGDSIDDYYSAIDNDCDFIFCSYGYGDYPVNISDIKSVDGPIELFTLLGKY